MSSVQLQLLDRVVQFQEKLGLAKPLVVVRSPGRINLIGEHTDYNSGFVLPGAVDKSVILAFTPRADDIVQLHSMDYDATHQAGLSALEPSELEWPNLVLGVLAQLRRSHQLSGFDLAYGADLPRAAGLSSSSAIACGVVFGLNQLFNLGLSINEMVWAAVRAEHEFMGVRCGVMDQTANLRAKEHTVLLLDCKDQSSQYIPLEPDKLCVVLCDSQVRRKLALSEYNKRRAQCEEGVATLAKIQPGVQSLRDVSLDFLQSNKSYLSLAVYRRCRFVIEENSRVLKMCEAIKNRDLAKMRDLLYASHEGLRILYRVSCIELNRLVDGALQIDGVHGARLMGAGFGGCTINLVEAAKLGNFLSEMTKVFRDKLRKSPKIHVTTLSRGTHVVDV